METRSELQQIISLLRGIATRLERIERRMEPREHAGYGPNFPAPHVFVGIPPAELRGDEPIVIPITMGRTMKCETHQVIYPVGSKCGPCADEARQ